MTSIAEFEALARHWRVGRRLGRTLYCDDICVGMVDTPELAAVIVAKMNQTAAEDLRQAREEERAKLLGIIDDQRQQIEYAKDEQAFAVRQARVEALREEAWTYRNDGNEYKGTEVYRQICASADRLEREQPKPAEPPNPIVAEAERLGRVPTPASHGPVVSPEEPDPKSLPVNSIGTCRRCGYHGPGPGHDCKPTADEAKGAPEIPEETWVGWEGTVIDDDWTLAAYTCERPGYKHARFIRTDVVERRVAEAVTLATAEAREEHVSLASILGAREDTILDAAARRVVAERDAAVAERNDMKTALEAYGPDFDRAEKAESQLADLRAQFERVSKDIEARISAALDTVQRPSMTHPEGAQGSVMRRAWELGRDYRTAGQAFLEQKTRAESAERELAEVRAKLGRYESHRAKGRAEAFQMVVDELEAYGKLQGVNRSGDTARELMRAVRFVQAQADAKKGSGG